MVEAAQVAGFRQDGQRVDRAYAGDLAQQLIVDVLGQPGMSEPLDLVALLDKAATLRDDHAEHGHGDRVLRHGQGYRGAGRLVDVVDEPCLEDLATDERPSRGRERLTVQRRDAGRSREPLDECQEPVGSPVARKAGDLGKVEWQIVGEDSVPGLRLDLRDGLVGFGELLQIVDPGSQRVDEVLRRTDPQHVQNDLGIFGIVLVPAVVQRLTRPGERDRRDEAQLEPCCQQSMCQRTMVIARRFEPDDDGTADGRELLGKAVIVLPGRHDRHPPAPAAFSRSIRTSCRFLDMSMATSTAPAGVGVSLVMVGRPPKCCLDNFTLDTC